MKRPLFLFVTLLAIAVPAVIFYLDWRIPRATATIQIHPSLMGATPSQNLDSSPRITR